MAESDPFEERQETPETEAKQPLWIFILLVLVCFLGYQWFFSISSQVARNIDSLSHPHSTVSGEAWQELQRLFANEWDAFEAVLENLDNREKVSFLIEMEQKEGEPKPIFKATQHPLFYRAETRPCVTVREALMAILHNDPKTKVPYKGNWEAWWRTNRAAFN